jgi:hypothetical protein
VRVGNVRMDHVRRCHCGRRPEISTGYQGFEDGFGPFVISCMHGLGSPVEQYEKVRRGELDAERYVLSRSWSKTRAVANWRRLMASHCRSQPTQPLLAPEEGRIL